MADRSYPFRPVRVPQLRSGELWSIPLSDGRFACGLVIEAKPVAPFGDEPMRSCFVGGLLAWVDDAPPTAAATSQVRAVLRHGYAGIRAINRCDGFVCDRRDLAAQPVDVGWTVSHRGGGAAWLLWAGAKVRPATRHERARLPVMPTLGYRVLTNTAEQVFGAAAVDPALRAFQPVR